jgi:chemotaxis protein CheX
MAAPKITSDHPFMNRDVIMNLSNGMSTTLKLMANIDTQFEKPFSDKAWSSPKEISVLLSLDSDFFKGQIVFHFDKHVAKKIIENMIGSQVAEDSPEILDGVGEISNIFYGAAKTKLKESGFNLQLTIPQPLWTKDLPVPIQKSIVMVIPFKVENKDCFVEITLF